jgi:hypothetical protein
MQMFRDFVEEMGKLSVIKVSRHSCNAHRIS